VLLRLLEAIARPTANATAASATNRYGIRDGDGASTAVEVDDVVLEVGVVTDEVLLDETVELLELELEADWLEVDDVVLVVEVERLDVEELDDEVEELDVLLELELELEEVELVLVEVDELDLLVLVDVDVVALVEVVDAVDELDVVVWVVEVLVVVEVVVEVVVVPPPEEICIAPIAKLVPVSADTLTVPHMVCPLTVDWTSTQVCPFQYSSELAWLTPLAVKQACTVAVPGRFPATEMSK